MLYTNEVSELKQEIEQLKLENVIQDDIFVIDQLANALDNLSLVKTNIEQYGVTPAIEALAGSIDLSTEGLKDKLKAGYEKVKKFILDLIDKIIKFFSNPVKKLGKQLKVLEKLAEEKLDKVDWEASKDVSVSQPLVSSSSDISDELLLTTTLMTMAIDNDWANSPSVVRSLMFGYPDSIKYNSKELTVDIDLKASVVNKLEFYLEPIPTITIGKLDDPKSAILKEIANYKTSVVSITEHQLIGLFAIKTKIKTEKDPETLKKYKMGLKVYNLLFKPVIVTTSALVVSMTAALKSLKVKK